DTRSHDIGSAGGGELRLGFLQAIRADIGDADLHAGFGEAHRGGEPNAGGTAGDDGNMIGGHGWQRHRSSPDQSENIIASSKEWYPSPLSARLHGRSSLIAKAARLYGSAPSL